MKSFVTRACFHGSANYRHDSFDPSKPPAVKMRAYESKKQHWGYGVDDSGNLTEVDTYQVRPPAEIVMEAILKDPHHIPFFPPFAKSRILLPGIFQSQRKYQDPSVKIAPGESVYVLGRPRLVSLTAFSFQFRKQYDSWSRTHASLNARYGVSFELWFTNPDGETVDYAKMLETLDFAICKGIDSPVRFLDSIKPRQISTTVKRFRAAQEKMKKHLNGRISYFFENELPIVHDDREAGFSGSEWE